MLSLKWGSPPLARGKPIFSLSIPPNVRITPACAGKTSMPRRDDDGKWDHPRLRGENFINGILLPVASGSPPLARGKPLSCNTCGRSRRITPACAGKTIPDIVFNPTSQDHPRLRGENAVVPIEIADRVGSPPLARGKHYC